MSRTSSNEASFATSVLTDLGAPVTQSNLDFIERWIAREGGGGANNPLNTTQQMSGSTALSGNSAGVQNYGDLDVGVQATVKTLRNGYYPNIVAALMAGNASQADAQGVLASDLSTWSGGGYSTVANVAIRPSNSIGSAGHAAGGTSSGTGLASLTGNDSGDIDGFLKSQAPEVARALGDPEVQQLLQKWGANQLSDDEFRNQLEQTNWWKNTPADARQNLANRATDPATAAQTFNDKLSAVNTLADKLGVGLTGPQAQQIATQWMNNSAWSSDQLQQAVAQYSKYQGDITYKGEAATDVNTLRGIYSEMALPTNDSTLNQQLHDVLAGTLTTKAIEDQVAQQAATFYSSNPELAQYLKSGQGSVRSWASPLISQAANILGLDPNSVDLTNPQWSFLLKPQTNPQTGQSLGMAQSLDSVEQKIKTDPMYGYSRTANGIQDYTNMIGKLQQAFTGGGV